MIPALMTAIHAMLATASGPMQLVRPDAPASATVWSVAAIALAVLSGASLLASLVTLLLWRYDKALSGDPAARAFTRLCAAWSLSSAQRRTAIRLAGELGPHAGPAAILLSRTALRRAVSQALERKPEPREVRDMQRLVERLIGDLPIDAAVPAGDGTPPMARRAAGRLGSTVA